MSVPDLTGDVRRAARLTVVGQAPFGEVVAALDGRVALAEPGGVPPSLDPPALLVGPEGGFAPVELETFVPALSFSG